MGIRVEHGPSMVPVGRMAYRTGQNEYINKRRKELEALAEQRANRQQKSQMQVNDINAGFQQIQMQHQMGMQRAAAQNEFQLDRDQRNQDWGVKAAGDLFNRQKELNDQRHQQGLARVEFGQDLQNQAMIDNNHAQEMTKTFDKLYGTSNQAGRGLMDDFGATQLKLRGHVKEGKITQEQFDAQYSEGMSELIRTLTGKNSEMYQIGAEHQVGGKTPMWGGAMERVVGEGGALIFDRRYEIDPATGEKETPEQWSERWEKVQFDGPNDKIGWHYEYGSDGTRTREYQQHLQGYTATNKFNMEATKLLIDRRAEEASTGADSMKSANEAVAQINIAYESNRGARPVGFVKGEPTPEEELAQQEWDAGLLAFKKKFLTREQQVAVGLIEPSEGLGQARLLGERPDTLKMFTPEQRQGMQQPGPEAAMPIPDPAAPDFNEGAAFDNKLNFLESMNI